MQHTQEGPHTFGLMGESVKDDGAEMCASTVTTVRENGTWGVTSRYSPSLPIRCSPTLSLSVRVQGRSSGGDDGSPAGQPDQPTNAPTRSQTLRSDDRTLFKERKFKQKQQLEPGEDFILEARALFWLISCHT